ncbi:alpha/beta fold hydrolase [Corynebacterium sp. 11266D000AW]
MTVLHYHDFPATQDTSRPVVLLGSIASSTAMWAPVADELAGDHRVIAIDHRGHGRSPDIAEPASMETLAADVLETLDAAGIDSFSVVGLSLGGAIAQYLAATSPRVERAAFLCTASYFGGPDKWLPRVELTSREGLAPMAESVVGLWLTDNFRRSHPATTAACLDMVLATRGSGYASCAHALAGWEFTERLTDITCPVLTLAGADDASTPPDTVHAIAERVAGPATTVTVPGAHVPTLESPAAVTKALADFLSA